MNSKTYIPTWRLPFHPELMIWPVAILLLAWYDPYAHSHGHFSLCVLHHLELPCLGCGLGHSISFLLHGDWSASWQAHWMGAPALGILIYRTVNLAYQEIKTSKTHNDYGTHG